jgi:hypothetical protein
VVVYDFGEGHDAGMNRCKGRPHGSGSIILACVHEFEPVVEPLLVGVESFVRTIVNPVRKVVTDSAPMAKILGKVIHAATVLVERRAGAAPSPLSQPLWSHVQPLRDVGCGEFGIAFGIAHKRKTRRSGSW